MGDAVDELSAEYARLAQQNTRDLAALSARLGGVREALAAAGGAIPPADECAWCGVALSRRLQCARCHAASFCCKEHQVAAWPSHKALCKALQQEAAAARRAGDSGTRSRAAPAVSPVPTPAAHEPATAQRSPAPVPKQRTGEAQDGPKAGAAEALELAHAAPPAEPCREEDPARPSGERAGT